MTAVTPTVLHPVRRRKSRRFTCAEGPTWMLELCSADMVDLLVGRRDCATRSGRKTAGTGHEFRRPWRSVNGNAVAHHFASHTSFSLVADPHVLEVRSGRLLTRASSGWQIDALQRWLGTVVARELAPAKRRVIPPRNERRAPKGHHQLAALVHHARLYRHRAAVALPG